MTLSGRSLSIVFGALAASLWLAGGVLGQDDKDGARPEAGAMTTIRVIVGETVLNATLDDSPAGQDFAALLPLDLTLSDYHGIEKVADLPRKLNTDGMPRSYAASTGDITYYAPWGNLAIFYKPFPSASGLVRLGAFDDPIDTLLKDGKTPVRIEAAD